MYELAEKKSPGRKIFLGIICLLAVTTTLKFLLKEPEISINEKLMTAASEINKHAPINVDSVTTLDNVVALPGNKLQYNYTITKAENDSVDTAVLLSNTKVNMINIIRTDPKSAFFLDNNVDVVVKYSDQNGVYLCKVFISHSEY